jgi:hypothetical protein
MKMVIVAPICSRSLIIEINPNLARVASSMTNIHLNSEGVNQAEIAP